MDNQEQMTQKEQVMDMGSATTKSAQSTIHCLTIVGQVEGHQILGENSKTTKYEHVLPILAAVEESGASVSVPRYNNLNNLLAELHAILGSTASYSINFSEEEAAPPMVTRDVSIQCAVGSYGEVVEIVRAVHDCASSCVITELSWSDKLAESARRYGVGYAQNAVPGADAGRYSVSMEVRCYEYAG